MTMRLPELLRFVIPAKAGIQWLQNIGQQRKALDSRLRGNDDTAKRKALDSRLRGNDDTAKRKALDSRLR
ncbi:MAG: hypothetical protein U1C54_15315, partial [Xanthomonadaceae bacterium]|nr:hypothetical protein [Xanthomonadaceae bacterium]